MTVDASLKQRVLAAAAARPSPTRPVSRARAALLYGLAGAFMLGVFFLAGGIAHSAGRPPALTWGLAGAASLLALAATIGASRGGSMLGRSAVVLSAVAVAVPVGTIVVLTSVSGLYAEPFARVGWRCMGLTLVMGVVLLAVAIWRRRRSLPERTVGTGAALGAVAGAWSGTLVDLWCPLTNLQHVLIGHAAPMAALGLLGAVVGGWALRVRPQR